MRSHCNSRRRGLFLVAASCPELLLLWATVNPRSRAEGLRWLPSVGILQGLAAATAAESNHWSRLLMPKHRQGLRAMNVDIASYLSNPQGHAIRSHAL